MQVHSACSVGTDGRTPTWRLKGRKFGTPLAGVAERVWLREPPVEKVNKFHPGWFEARLLGFCFRSFRYVVGAFQGRFRLIQTVKSISFEDRGGRSRRRVTLSRLGFGVDARRRGEKSVSLGATPETSRSRATPEKAVFEGRGFSGARDTRPLQCTGTH